MNMQDYNLSEHFRFFELTDTSNAQLIDLNREKSNFYLDSLKALSQLLEKIRDFTGPLQIHSGFRCLELNSLTSGSSKTSQHMKGEAADFSRVGPKTLDAIEGLFGLICDKVETLGIKFGQLILESAERPYGAVNWVHMSLGDPFRELPKCGQILKMENGVYTMLKEVTLK